MRKALKKVAQKLLPDQFYTQITSVRSRNYQRKFLQERGLLRLTEKMIERHGTSVLHGPFRGMIYPADSLLARNGTPKLLGSYESELHPSIAAIIARADQYERLIDIGCAEGYYAVGLAFATQARVDAFDTEPRELAFCRDMAQLNGVSDRIDFRGWCDADYLASLRDKRCFIISDCEGYEAQLFDERGVSGVNRSDLIIELHNVGGLDMPALMQTRFAATHDLHLIAPQPRDATQYDELEFLGDEAAKSISEFRSNSQSWAYLTPKS